MSKSAMVRARIEAELTGIVAMLCPKVPQGINPDILLIDLVLIQRPGIWPQLVTWIPAKYDKIIVNSTYKTVNVFCEDNIIADIPVIDVN